MCVFPGTRSALVWKDSGDPLPGLPAVFQLVRGSGGELVRLWTLVVPADWEEPPLPSCFLACPHWIRAKSGAEVSSAFRNSRCGSQGSTAEGSLGRAVPWKHTRELIVGVFFCSHNLFIQVCQYLPVILGSLALPLVSYAKILSENCYMGMLILSPCPWKSMYLICQEIELHWLVANSRFDDVMVLCRTCWC